MKAEEAIIDLKDKKPPTKDELRRSRTIAVVLAGFLIITLVAVVYAFVQQTEAKRQAEIANQIMQESKVLEYELVKVKEEMNQRWMLAEQQRLIAVEALNTCLSSQKKK